jgi:hypothetical protein
MKHRGYSSFPPLMQTMTITLRRWRYNSGLFYWALTLKIFELQYEEHQQAFLSFFSFNIDKKHQGPRFMEGFRNMK